MQKLSRLTAGLRHRPSIIPALGAEAVSILIASAAMAMLIAAVAALDIINLRSLQIQILLLSTGVAMLGLLVTILENSPWAHRAAHRVQKRTGIEHVALWMLLLRLVLLPVVMVVCLYGRREIFYQLNTPAYPAGVAFAILAITAFWVRKRSR